VLNAISGEPLAGATVQVYYQEYDRQRRGGRRVAGPAAKTDDNGLFSIKTDDRKSFLVFVRHQGQTLASGRDYHTYTHRVQERPGEQTIFFTDRALYRPGQTIRYKGISIRVDQQRDDYKTIAGRVLTVIFSDPNGNEVARHNLRTNDYGSFSGSFTAPRPADGPDDDPCRGRPAGGDGCQCRGVQAAQVPGGSRETENRCQIEFRSDTPGQSGGLHGLPGQRRARAIPRGARGAFPPWWRWYGWFPPSESQEIAHGQTTTGADGEFEIQFLARPDLSVPAKDEPVFHYTIHADVTDSGRRDPVGRTGGPRRLYGLASGAERRRLADRRPARTGIDPHHHAGRRRPVGRRLAEDSPPGSTDQVQRAPLPGPYQPYRRRSQRRDRTRPDLSDPQAWPLGEVVEERGFTTDADGHARHTFELPAGAYRAVVETQDRFDVEVTSKLPIQVLRARGGRVSPSRSRMRSKRRSGRWSRVRSFARCGVRATTGPRLCRDRASSPAGQSLLDRARPNAGGDPPTVSEAMRGGFTLRVTMIRENRAYTTARRVEVPWTNKQLTVRWERFVSKLGPADKETWTAVISGPDAEKAVAEMVATLYDASLDAYLPHHWRQAFGVFRTDHSPLQMQFENEQEAAAASARAVEYRRKTGR
jgi:hypothetical protein